MKKFVFVIFLAIICVSSAQLWESVYVERSAEQQLAALQKRLHRAEKYADRMLHDLKGEEVPGFKSWRKKKTTLVTFKNKELLYWSDKRVGTPDLYEQLSNTHCLVKLNNAYYDVRVRKAGEMEYYALIFLKDDYPTANNYVHDEINPYLGLNIEDAGKIVLDNTFQTTDRTVYNQEGEKLFRVEGEVHYHDRLPNYFVLLLYFISIYLFFIAYSTALKHSTSVKMQFFWMGVFLVFFIALRGVMVYYRVPYSLYNLSIFNTASSQGHRGLTVGDLFMTLFCIVHYIYITLRQVCIKFQEPRLMRYRYLFLIVFGIGVFLYMNFIHYSINSLISNIHISLNVARIINISFSSMLAFITSVIGIMGMLILIDGSVRFFHKFFSLEEVALSLVLWWGLCAVGCYFVGFSLSPGECIFACVLYGILLINVYMVKGEARKTIFITCIVLVSFYVTYLSESSEVDREMEMRSRYAHEFIQERDTVFERKLCELNRQILQSDTLTQWVKSRDEKRVADYIFTRLANLSDYKFRHSLALKVGDHFVNDSTRLLLENNPNVLEHFRWVAVDSTNFYNVNYFDALTTYVGCFEYPQGDENITLYLRFDSQNELLRAGYPQILSIAPFDANTIVYPYSYAKYRDGRLLFSDGSFNYYRTLDRFKSSTDHGRMFDGNGYSHLSFPVDGTGLFVISLDKSFFAPYSLNVLYAILVCLLLASYGILFQFDRNLWQAKHSTLKKRIKSNIIGLVCLLLLITAALSINMTSVGFGRRLAEEVVKLANFVKKEMEHYPCVEAQQCPEINSQLGLIAQKIKIDINVYDTLGYLVSTSSPSIFTKGFDGILLNPEAKRKIVDEQVTSYVQEEQIGELKYMGTYMPLELDNGERYVLCIPYFTKSDELNRDIALLVVIFINVAMIVIGLAFVLSGFVADRVTQPLQLVNEKLRLMRVGGKNEKIIYEQQDEVGELVKEYNNMVDVVDANVKKLSKAERESAWREMARQIAHEIKNPLTPMKLNIQFLRRTLQGNNMDETRRRFEDISDVLMEQIDHMASIATAFSDFAKVSVTNTELFNFSELVEGCTKLFDNNVVRINTDIEPEVYLYGDKEQLNRVLVNLLKNAEQSIPEERDGVITIVLKSKRNKVLLSVQDNGEGIPEEIRERIAEPNFTTKTGGMGLGLALSYRIVETMGGAIWFESKVDEGTIFYVSLKPVKL